MNFTGPHLDCGRDACIRLGTDCVPAGAGFAVSVEQRLREREQENRPWVKPPTFPPFKTSPGDPDQEDGSFVPA